MTVIRNAYKISDGKPEEKRPHIGPKRKCENNIKVNPRKAGLNAWIGFIWLRIGTGGGLIQIR
jgi:hypothetical protein